ncbi:MAG: PAS domain S-box protein [Chloroflexi bacterium]|nr:PAS domain S-box protein [Chloroflexota bacterium]
MDAAVAQIILHDRNIAYVVTDRALRVVEVSGAPQILRGDGGGVLGRPLTELVPELIGSEGALADILLGELPRFELPLVNREGHDGQTLYLTMVDLPYRDRADRIVGLVHLIEDVTVMGGLEQRLTQQRNELRFLRDELQHQMSITGKMAKIGGWEFDTRTRKGAWTDEVARIHDLDPAVETNVELGISFYQGQSRSQIEAAIREALELGKPFDLELEMTTARGRHKWVRTVGQPVKEGDTVVKVQGTFQDITERKQAEEAVQESERHYRSLFENMLEGFAYCRMLYEDNQPQDFIHLDVNSAFEQLTGLKDVIGRPVTEVIPGIRESNPELFEAYGRVALTGKPERFETYLEFLDIWLSVAVYSPKREYFISVFDNITDRRRAEEALRQLNAELEQRVVTRTGELSDRVAEVERLNRTMTNLLEDLQAANRQATDTAQRLKEANAELETFTYSVSHDLKAPLRGMDGYSRLVLENYADRLDDEGRNFLHNIRRAATQMSQLIDDLLAYSRVERRTLVQGQVNPRSLAERLVAERVSEIHERGVHITVDIPCTSVTTEIEGLTQALHNLLDNALKFTRNVPQAMIEVGGRETETSCILWVADNGPGFDMKYHDRIFEIFQRLHRAEDYPGTGIGLAIVRKAMQRLGGRAWAESEPGKGATFYLEVPR